MSALSGKSAHCRAWLRVIRSVITFTWYSRLHLTHHYKTNSPNSNAAHTVPLPAFPVASITKKHVCAVSTLPSEFWSRIDQSLIAWLPQAIFFPMQFPYCIVLVSQVPSLMWSVVYHEDFLCPMPYICRHIWMYTLVSQFNNFKTLRSQKCLHLPRPTCDHTVTWLLFLVSVPQTTYTCIIYTVQILNLCI